MSSLLYYLFGYLTGGKTNEKLDINEFTVMGEYSFNENNIVLYQFGISNEKLFYDQFIANLVLNLGRNVK